MSQHAPIIPKVYLQGHQAPVLCLDHSSSLRNNEVSNAVTPMQGCLLSGSEDGTVRLWDLRANNNRASLCLVLGTEVMSVAFAPPSPTTFHQQLASAFARNFCVYLSSGSQVYAYDLRHVQSPIVREPPQVDLSATLGSTDEVNQISLSPWRKPPVYLAAGDDAGTVRVVDTTNVIPQSLAQPTTNHSPPRSATLYHDPTGVAIVTSTSFRPRSKGWELASGGTDCCVHVWDVTKPKRPSCSYRITPDPHPSEQASTNQVCNPPMVHTLAWSPSGRLLAVGLGDGTCRVLRVEGRSSCVEVARLENGHDAPVASVVFPEWSRTSSTTTPTPACGRHVTAQDRFLMSGGNDGAILGWDLGSVVASDGAHDPALLVNDSVLLSTANHHHHQTQQPATRTLDAAMQRLSVQMDIDDDPCRPPYILFHIAHGDKPNWMTSSRGLDSVFPSTLFVADTTNNITAYTIPLQ